MTDKNRRSLLLGLCALGLGVSVEAEARGGRRGGRGSRGGHGGGHSGGGGSRGGCGSKGGPGGPRDKNGKCPSWNK